MEKYTILCSGCGKDLGKQYLPTCCPNSFPYTVYSEQSLQLLSENNIWKFYNWLPCDEKINTSSRSVTYKSEALANELDLENLYISFNGYWPEKNAFNETGTFKDLEAPPTLARLSNNKISLAYR